MRKLSRKAFSIVMSIVLVVGLCPGLAYAGDGGEDVALSSNALMAAASADLSAQVDMGAQGTASSYGYIWPLKYAGTISQQYGNNGHTGTDIAIGKGNDVVSMMDGTVKYVQKWDGKTKTGMQSYGNLVVVYHPKTGAATYYAHLNDISVSTGQSVSQYQTIGHVGTAGNSTGYHLHLELHLNAKSGLNTYGGSDGTRTNPMNYVSSSNIGPVDNYITISDGVYTVHSAVDKYKVLDIKDSSKAEYANLQISASTCAANQQFRFQRYSDGSYKITNVNSGKALDVEGGGTADKTNVRQYTVNDTNAQRWFIEDAGNGRVRFRGKGSGKYLDVNGASSADGTNVQIYTGNTSNAQIFELSAYSDFGTRTTSLSDGYYTMLAACGKTYAVDANGGSAASETNLQLWVSLQNNAQVFHIVKQNDGYYRITPQSTDAVAFDVYGGNMTDGTNVRLFTANNSYAQKWIARTCDGGLYAFQCVGTGKFLDAHGGTASNGTNMNQWVGNGTNAQKFYLVPWDKSMSGNRISVQGMGGTYIATGKAITPAPDVKWLANSFDSLRVPDSGNATGGYANRRMIDAKAGRTYIIEIDKAERLAGSAANGQVRAVGSDGLDVSARGTVKWSGGKQTITMKPTKDCSLYIYPAVADATKGCAAQFTGIRVYEQLVSGTDYTVSYKDNVNAGTATATMAGKGSYAGSRSATFTIKAAQQTAPSGSSSGSGASGGSSSGSGSSGPSGSSSNPSSGSSGAAPSAPVVATQQMHRLYNPNSGEHFYTSNAAERDNVMKAGWTYEGVGWTAPATSGSPVYRLYNANGGEHHYTTNKAERDNLVRLGWKDEGIGWYSDDAKAAVLHRLYNPNAFANNHHYTTSESERDWLVSLGWKYEGVGWYGA